MAQKQSVAEQQAIIKDIKEQVANRANTNFGYEILQINPNINNSQWIQQARKMNYKVADIVKEFNNDLDTLLANRATAVIKIRLFGKKVEDTILETTIVIREEYADFVLPSSQQQQQQHNEPAQPAQAQPVQAQPQIDVQSADRNMTVANILTLMGFGGLAGDGNANGLDQILNVRDGLKDMRFENLKREEKINKLTADLAATQQERDQLKRDIEKLERQLEKADERIEDLELDIDEKNEQIRKLHPELSLMGTSLTALLGAGIKNFAMNHANTIGGLMGIDGDALRTMLANDEPAAIGGGEEADDNSDGRADECKQIREFIKTLNDKEWQDFYQLMRVFAANKETIAIVLAIAKGGSGAQQNDVEEQQ
ncbi:MAG: hypothetical protein IKO46_05920 [Salinivirgaceae bacterium]|nr:hypothetical protein [Salinivirgaceae bacterium]